MDPAKDDGEEVALPRPASLEAEEEGGIGIKEDESEGLLANTPRTENPNDAVGKDSAESFATEEESKIQEKPTPLPVRKIIIVCAVIASSSFSYTMLYAIVGFMVS